MSNSELNNNNPEDILDEDVLLDDDLDIDIIDLDAESDILNEESSIDEEAPQSADDKKKVSKASILRYGIMIVSACLFVFAAVMLTTYFLNYRNGQQTYENASKEVFKPNPNRPTDDNSSTEEGNEFYYDHNALLAINPDSVGYLVMPGIDIQYPIVTATDNDYYLNHDIYGNESIFGALFIDSYIKEGFNSSHVIVYGHNMYDGSMFAKLARYKEESFFMDDANTVFYIYSENKRYTYRIFSVYETSPTSDTYDINFKTLNDMRTYANAMKKKSMYTCGVTVGSATQIMTFSTCTSDSQRRVIVHSILIGANNID